MPVPNLAEYSRYRAQLRSFLTKMGAPYNHMPTRVGLARVMQHGGLSTMLDVEMMTARMAAFNAAKTAQGEKPAKPPLTVDAAGKLRETVKSFFYKLVDKEGYVIHSELMAYISEPGRGNGVTFSEGAEASSAIPGAFTFVGQFIDHDLTLNAINLTEDERDVIAQDKASPVIDLDSVYGISLKDIFSRQDISSGKYLQSPKYAKFREVFDKIFDERGYFRLRPTTGSDGKAAFDLCREDDGMGGEAAVIFDPRNDENQLILQIHILVERFHNKLIEKEILKSKIGNITDPAMIVEKVREEVVATWQSFVLNDYMTKIIRKEVFDEVLKQIHVEATDPDHPEKEYGNLRHKPYRDLTNGKNVVRMPHEFAIGFRFGHSQLRPFYVLNEKNVVILFKDARVSVEIPVYKTALNEDCSGEKPYIKVSGRDDLRGNRKLSPDHVIDWKVFYPPDNGKPDNTKSLLIDGKVTARVFNLPESAIPDDIKYIGNLPHRNLIRSTQIGIVSGEELAGFYGYTGKDVLTPDQVLGGDAGRCEVEDLFKLDSPFDPELPKELDPSCYNGRRFKTPLWYYLLKEAEVQSGGIMLGKAGSRLVAEVLMGALYYGNVFPIDDDWKSSAIKPAKPQKYGNVKLKDSITLRDIIEFVNDGTANPKFGDCSND